MKIRFKPSDINLKLLRNSTLYESLGTRVFLQDLLLIFMKNDNKFPDTFNEDDVLKFISDSENSCHYFMNMRVEGHLKPIPHGVCHKWGEYEFTDKFFIDLLIFVNLSFSNN